MVARYLGPDGKPTQEWPHNPNGSPGAVAGVCDPTGRLFGLMPHPDAYLYPFHHPQWTRRMLAGTLPAEGSGMRIFRNGVAAAKYWDWSANPVAANPLSAAPCCAWCRSPPGE